MGYFMGIELDIVPVLNIWGFPWPWGYPKMDCIIRDKLVKMDDNSGYPHLWKPPDGN